MNKEMWLFEDAVKHIRQKPGGDELVGENGNGLLRLAAEGKFYFSVVAALGCYYGYNCILKPENRFKLMPENRLISEPGLKIGGCDIPEDAFEYTTQHGWRFAFIPSYAIPVNYCESFQLSLIPKPNNKGPDYQTLYFDGISYKQIGYLASKGETYQPVVKENVVEYQVFLHRKQLQIILDMLSTKQPDNEDGRLPAEKKVSIQDKRELFFKGWLVANGHNIGDRIENYTRAQLWDELKNSNSKLFNTPSKNNRSLGSTAKRFFKIQKLCKFK